MAFLQREITNNQKFSLSFDRWSDCLVSGAIDGSLHVFERSGELVQTPSLKVPLHMGPFTGCEFNPRMKVLCTASGCRTFDFPGDTFIDKQNTEWKVPDSRICLWAFDSLGER